MGHPRYWLGFMYGPPAVEGSLTPPMRGEAAHEWGIQIGKLWVGHPSLTHSEVWLDVVLRAAQTRFQGRAERIPAKLHQN